MTIPVVVIHGANRGPMAMALAARHLRRSGFDPRQFSWSSRRDRLEEAAAALERFLDDWLSAPVPVLGLLTHSMGGLVARAYLRDAAAQHSQAQRLVMLGTPNQGAELAGKLAARRVFQWAYGQAAEELQPGYPNRLGPLPDSADGLILLGGTGGRGYNPLIQGDDDFLVAHSDAPLEGVPLEKLGGVHGILRSHPKVLRRASKFLKGEG